MKKYCLTLNWSWITLGDICEFIYGKGLTKHNRDQNGKYPVYGSNGIVGFHNEYLVKGPCLIIGRKGAAGEVHLSNTNCWAIDTTYYITENEKYLLPYLYYVLKNLKLNTLDKSTAIPGLNRNDAYNLQIPLPPLPEQKKIVAKIEELFSELDKGIEQLKKAKEQLRVYRQSVLSYAFSGRLLQHSADSKAQRGMLKAAEPEIKYSLNQDSSDSMITTNKDEKSGESLNLLNPGSDSLPTGWRYVQFNTVCEKIQDGSHFSPTKQYDKKAEGRYLYITSKNIRNNYMDLSNITYVDKSFHEAIFSRCNPQFGDILLTKDGANTGNVTLNTLHEGFSLLSSVCLIKPKKELKAQFLKYYIQSPNGFKEITGAMTGTAIKRIILRNIKEAKIVLPPLSQQIQIVAEIESHFSVADKLEQAINENLKKSEALRQSILNKAFGGKLI